MRGTFAFVSVLVPVLGALGACWTSTSSYVAEPGADRGSTTTVPPPIVAVDACANDSCGDAGPGLEAGADGGPFRDDGGVVGSGCVSDVDCTDGGRCGYPVLSLCAATGVCAVPAPPVVDGALRVACGCDGQNVGYVTASLAAAPVASLTPCADGGNATDAGLDASD